MKGSAKERYLIIIAVRGDARARRHDAVHKCASRRSGWPSADLVASSAVCVSLIPFALEGAPKAAEVTEDARKRPLARVRRNYQIYRPESIYSENSLAIDEHGSERGG